MAAYMAANMGLDAAVKNLPDAAVKNLPVDHKHAAQQEPQKQQELHKEQELQKQQKRQQQSKHQMNKQDQQQEQHQGEEQQEQHPHKPSELELAKADFEKSNKRFTEVVVGVGETIGKNMWNHAVWWSQGVAGIVMFVPMMFWSLGQSVSGFFSAGFVSKRCSTAIMLWNISY